MESISRSPQTRKISLSLLGQWNCLRDRLDGAKSWEFSLYEHIFWCVSTWYRKISRLEERKSLWTGFMMVFVKNWMFQDQILHSCGTVSPIRDRRTAFDSGGSITRSTTSIDSFQRRNQRTRVFKWKILFVMLYTVPFCCLSWSTRRNVCIMLSIDTFSSSSRWDVERNPYSNRKDGSSPNWWRLSC
jgi:hypothetical protein